MTLGTCQASVMTANVQQHHTHGKEEEEEKHDDLLHKTLAGWRSNIYAHAYVSGKTRGGEMC